MRFLLLAMMFVPQLAFAAKKAQTRAQVHTAAMKAYEGSEWKAAADLFAKEVTLLKPAEQGKKVEQDAREKLCLSLLLAGKKPEAIAEFRALRAKFPAFAFNDNEIDPETILVFESAVAPAKPKPEEPPPPVVVKVEPQPTPASTLVVSPDSPRKVEPVVTAPVAPKKQWHWYYLTPLGIGQFAAGSPVRGTIFAILQAGLVAADVALFVHYNSFVSPTGEVASEALIPQADRVRLAMNIVFFTMIGSFIAGIVDGAALEP